MPGSPVSIQVPAESLRRSLAAAAITVLAAAAPAVGAPTAAPHGGKPAQASGACPAVQRALDEVVAAGVPGAMVLHRHGPRERFAAAGVADLATQRPIRRHDRLRVASITKSFVATTVLKLAAAGRLSLDDSVERWLPGLVPSGGAITIRHLLGQTSGLHDYLDAPFYVELLRNPLEGWTPRELVRRATAQPPLFAPGTSWAYSNTNYVLLGLVVAAADDLPAGLERRSPAIEIARRISAPLGLWRTSLPLVDPDIVGPHVRGYAIGAPPEWGLPPVLDTTRLNPSSTWAAGAMVSTLDDVADFHRALFAGDLLAPAQQRELTTTVPAPGLGVDYGLGVYRLQTPCGPAWGHDGALPTGMIVSLVSADGTRQAVIFATRDVNTWTPQIATGYAAALMTALCGAPAPAAHARRLATQLGADRHRAADRTPSR